jgi:hypothetical protein
LVFIIKVKKYYSKEEELNQFYQKLKLIQCPHCKLIGCLILHGFLYGYDEKIYNKTINRGKRFFCSNRNKRKGCGKTFSILKSNIIKGFIITTNSIWKYLNNLTKGISKKEAFNYTKIIHTDSTIYRLYNRFKLSQHNIRTLLTRISRPPQLKKTTKPVIQTILHLKDAFREYNCPITAFQYTFQTSFL